MRQNKKYGKRPKAKWTKYCPVRNNSENPHFLPENITNHRTELNAVCVCPSNNYPGLVLCGDYFGIRYMEINNVSHVEPPMCVSFSKYWFLFISFKRETWEQWKEEGPVSLWILIRKSRETVAFQVSSFHFLEAQTLQVVTLVYSVPFEALDSSRENVSPSPGQFWQTEYILIHDKVC